MQDYEYKDEGGRFLCKLHHKLRCDECHYVSDLQQENERYREIIQDFIDHADDYNIAKAEKYHLRKALEESE